MQALAGVLALTYGCHGLPPACASLYLIKGWPSHLDGGLELEPRGEHPFAWLSSIHTT
jgi:hypothetical protein